MRDIRKKLLPDNLQPLESGNVKEDAHCAAGSITVRRSQGYNSQVEDPPFLSVSFDFYAGAFLAADRIEKRIIDRRISRQLRQATRVDHVIKIRKEIPGGTV